MKLPVFILAVALLIGLNVAAWRLQDTPHNVQPRYAFCSLNGTPTYAVPDAVSFHVTEAGIMEARDSSGAEYALRMREGETCTLETAINMEVTP